MPISIPSRRRSDRTSSFSHSEPLHALLVDDDSDYLTYVSALTERSGFEVTRAPDGPSAVTSLEGTHFDLIVVDQEMPRVTGLELIGTLREHESARGAFALMLTGREDVLTKVAALDAGFDDFVRKSESEAEIAAKLIAARRVIMRQRALDRAANELYGLATRDELTGLYNRRLFLAEAERMLAGGPLCLILFDHPRAPLDRRRGADQHWRHGRHRPLARRARRDHLPSDPGGRSRALRAEASQERRAAPTEAAGGVGRGVR